MTPEEKFARYKELVEAADAAMDRAVELQTPEAWRAAEAKNGDAADFWMNDLSWCATEEAKRYRAAHLKETLSWLKK